MVIKYFGPNDKTGVVVPALHRSRSPLGEDVGQPSLGHRPDRHCWPCAEKAWFCSCRQNKRTEAAR